MTADSDVIHSVLNISAYSRTNSPVLVRETRRKMEWPTGALDFDNTRHFFSLSPSRLNPTVDGKYEERRGMKIIHALF